MKRCSLAVATSLNYSCLLEVFINLDHFKSPFWNLGQKTTVNDDRNKLISFFKPSHSLVGVARPEGAVVPSDVRRKAAVVSVTLWHVQSERVLKPLSMETSPALHEL